LTVERVTGTGIGASAGRVTVYNTSEQRIHQTEESENLQWDPPSRLETRFALLSPVAIVAIIIHEIPPKV
jgi:hypothetical protein